MDVRLRFRLIVAGTLGIAVGATSLLVGRDLALAEPPKAGRSPDPPPRPSTKHWVFDISVKQGKVDVVGIKPLQLSRAESTARMMGRYAIELYVGRELLDRIRFNVPGAGDGPREEDRRPNKGPRFDRVTTSFKVRMADNPRATRAKFVDRASGTETAIPWPPASAQSQVLDAGVDGAVLDGGADAKAGDAGNR